MSAAEMKYMRRTTGYIWTDYKTNKEIANRLPRVMKQYCVTGRRDHGGPLNRILDT
jgi:hypothetical protein